MWAGKITMRYPVQFVWDCVYTFTRLCHFVFMYTSIRGNVPLKSAWDVERRKKYILFSAVSPRTGDLQRGTAVGGYMFNMYTSHAHVGMYFGVCACVCAVYCRSRAWRVYILRKGWFANKMCIRNRDVRNLILYIISIIIFNQLYNNIIYYSILSRFDRSFRSVFAYKVIRHKICY